MSHAKRVTRDNMKNPEYHVALCLLILNLLEMRHNHVLVLRIFKILKRCHFWQYLVAPCVFIAPRNIFRWKVCGFKIVSYIIWLCVF